MEINQVSEVYRPKISRLPFYLSVILLNFFAFPIIINIAMPPNAGLGGIVIGLFIIFFQLIFSILLIISYEILVKKEKDKTKYNPLNHINTYKIITSISVIVLLASIVSSTLYLFPLIKNYEIFKLLELVKNSQYTYWGYLPEMYINNFFNANFITLRYVIMIAIIPLLYLSIKKFSIARVYLLWLISFIVCAQVFLKLDLFMASYTVYINKVNSIIIQTNGILEYDKVIATNNPDLCSSISNERAQSNCKNYFFQISKIKK